MSTEILDGYMTPDELAKQLNKSAMTLFRWRSQKKGPPFIRVGRDVLYSREAVRRWLSRLETKTQL